ncbi:glycosyltransferase [Gordonia polyisoprenivorans]|uniref:glycosyltransferase n=1 Tax=Gordonia polyisoprenivorans TaxID=84595 RepID=UPI001B8D035A|nr:glycosyltransferase [Gordonia polyisoprenivorans]
MPRVSIRHDKTASAADTSKPSVGAIFACYNPPLTVADNIRECAKNVDWIVVVDDGSPDRTGIEELRAKLGANVELIVKSTNRGIADSINIGIEYASEREAKYLFTFDQDTRVVSSTLQRLLHLATQQEANTRRFGAIGPGSVGVFSMNYGHGDSQSSVSPVVELVQSCSLFSVDALLAIGGADVSLVIDAVDTDLCLRLIRDGYTVSAVPDLHIDHAIGSGESIRLLGRNVMLSNHSAERRYYMTRNRVRMLVRWSRYQPGWAILYARRMFVSSALAVTLEADRILKAEAIIEGTIDALCGKRGKRHKIDNLGHTRANC